MVDVVDDTAKLLRAIANSDWHAASPDRLILEEAARRCEAVADFVKATDSGHIVEHAAYELIRKLKNTS